MEFYKNVDSIIIVSNDRLLSELEADEFVLIGIDTENAVMKTALGLIQRGKNVRLIVDALGTHNKNMANLAIRKMVAKGTKLSQTSDFAGISHLKYMRMSRNQNCIESVHKSVKYATN